MFYLLDLLVLKSFLKKSYERYTRNLGYYGGPTMVLTSTTLMSLGVSIPVFSRTSGGCRFSPATGAGVCTLSAGSRIHTRLVPTYLR